jgi:hypothetical protein
MLKHINLKHNSWNSNEAAYCYDTVSVYLLALCCHTLVDKDDHVLTMILPMAGVWWRFFLINQVGFVPVFRWESQSKRHAGYLPSYGEIITSLTSCTAIGRAVRRKAEMVAAWTPDLLFSDCRSKCVLRTYFVTMVQESWSKKALKEMRN